MLAKRIIPCLDVKEGRVVKGINFLNLVDAGDPVESAIQYDKEGADELVFLDITASYEKREIMLNTIRRTAEYVFIPLTVGGGIKNSKDIQNLLRAGADKISINTSAVKNPDFVKEAADHFGSQCIVVAVDAKRRSHCNDNLKWDVYTHGGREKTGLDAVEWMEMMEEYGAGEILLTSMDRDGTKNGYDNDLLQKITDSINIPVIASGGAGNLQHLYEGFAVGGADAVLAASIFHFGEYRILDAKNFLADKGINVRI